MDLPQGTSSEEILINLLNRYFITKYFNNWFVQGIKRLFSLHNEREATTIFISGARL